MPKAVRFGLIGGGVYFLIKICILIFDLRFTGIERYLRFTGFSFILLFVVFLSVRFYARQVNISKASIIDLVKQGMKAALMFSISASLLSFSYYKWIDQEYFALRFAEMKEKALEYYETQATEDELDNRTPQEAYEQWVKDAEANPLTQAVSFIPVTLISGILLGVFYSFFMAVIYRQVLYKYDVGALRE